MPQFATAWPQRTEYDKPWKSWPSEIPDAFVREFGSWCAEHSVKGKYSIVPYPACVGWLDRELPGWSRQELQDSLMLVRDLMVPNWDIHPEMITHTRVIDLKTGRPPVEISAATMENSFPPTDLSLDELTAYLAYALRILKNCDLPCEGITTPGGFGNNVKDKLPIAVFDAVRDVYGSELPHYFKYVSSGDESVLPKFEHLRGLDTDSPTMTVNVPAATGDWFGGWDGSLQCESEKYVNEDASAGRMVELIERGDPAIMLCHWPGLYNNGTQVGFRDFQRIVLALESRFGDQTLWMKPSEIGRYWTAMEFTKVTQSGGNEFELRAPFACNDFTCEIYRNAGFSKILHSSSDSIIELVSVSSVPSLSSGKFVRDANHLKVCFSLAQGINHIRFAT
jgi:hypothetical protein